MIEALALGAPAGFAVTAGLSLVAPSLVGRRRALLLGLIAAVAAVAARAAGTEPSGTGIVDALLAPVFAVVAVVLATRARPWTVVVVAAAAAAVSVTSPRPVAAFAAAGAALAMAVTIRAPLLTAVVGATVVNAALRLHLGGPNGSEAAVGAVLVGVIAVSAYRRLGPPAQRRCHRAALAGGVALAGAGCLGALALAQARPRLERGIDVAKEALTAARSANPGRADDQFAVAATHFAQAERGLEAWWAQPGRALPILGPHLRAVRTVAVTGVDLSAAGGGVAAAAGVEAIRVEDGQVPLDQVVALHRSLATASTTVDGAMARLREARSPWLVAPVAERLDSDLARLAEAQRPLATTRDLVGVLPAMLGADRPRTWFLAMQTPSEARGSGGFIGSFGEVVADDGRLELVRSGRVGELNLGGDPAGRTLVGPPDYVARYERFEVATAWQNVTMSPHFPSVGKVIAGLYPQSGGRRIDGVIAVDPAGMAALLRLTGPISVALWPEPLSAENAERILLYDQYRTLPKDDRIDFLGDVTRALFVKLTTGELADAPTILEALGPAVEGKHVLLTAVDEAEEAALDGAGANGAMAPVRGDALAVVSQNAGGNKIDWFLRRTVDYRPKVDPATGALTATVAVTLENKAPAAGLPDYLIGNAFEPLLPEGTNRLYLSVYTPWRLAGARVDGAATQVESEVEVGRRVYSTYVDIPPKGRVVVELDLMGVLAGVGAGGGDRYRLDVHAQPMVKPDRASVTLGAGPTEHLVLSRDRTVRASLG